LVTGSRSGLLIGLIGIISALFLYKPRSSDGVKKAKGYRLNPLYLLAALSVIALSALSILFSRAQAVQRLSGLDQDDDLRFKIWQPIIEIAANFLPTGSGAGTFSSTYQVYEARAQLGPTIVNQAHNDWLDHVLTSGYPGMVLVALAGIGFLNLTWQALRNPMKAGRSVQFSRLGAVIIFLVVIAALVDYALRTPIIAAVFVISLIWLKSILEDRSSRKKFSNGVSVSQVS
jgi:ABC-type multidrug transport system fused ATPase/permease subunit